MTFSLDGAANVREQVCSRCGAAYALMDHFILKDGYTHAIAKTALHHHDGEHAAWIDVIFGTFDGGPTDQRVTFGCRVGPVEGSGEPAATVVDAAQPYPESPLWGHKLPRQEALQHGLLGSFWDVVDWLLISDPIVYRHVYNT